MCSFNLAPIIVSVYDRLEHLRRCIDALLKNDLAAQSEIYIVSDAPYKPEHEDAISKVREFAQSINGFKEVHCLFRKHNLGAHESIRNAIEEVLSIHDCFIFLEDDIVVAKDFLSFMNRGLEYYNNTSSVFAISGFSLPFNIPADYNADVYFYPCNSPWGFASWKNRWSSVNLNYYNREAELLEKGEYSSFASIGFYIKGILRQDSQREIEAMDLRVYYHMFKHNMASVFPVVSKTQNWGFDGSGEHCGKKDSSWWSKPNMDAKSGDVSFIPFNGYNEQLLKNHRDFQDRINGGFIARIFKYTKLYYLIKRTLKHIS